MTVRVGLAFALLVLALVFMMQNRASTSLKIFTLTIWPPLRLILLVPVVIGGLIGVLLRRRGKP